MVNLLLNVIDIVSSHKLRLLINGVNIPSKNHPVIFTHRTIEKNQRHAPVQNAVLFAQIPYIKFEPLRSDSTTAPWVKE